MKVNQHSNTTTLDSTILVRDIAAVGVVGMDKPSTVDVEPVESATRAS